MSIRQDIAECLGVDGAYSDDILMERLRKYLRTQDEQLKGKEEMENSVKDHHKISQFPIQDTFWHLQQVILNHKDLLHLRMLVLVDAGMGHSCTIQFSLVQLTHTSYEDQATQLLYQGCFYPLDGRRSRRPRFLYLIDSNNASHIKSEVDQLGIHFCGSNPSKDDLEILKHRFENTCQFRQCSVCRISGTPDLFHHCAKCDAVLYCGEKCQKEDWEESHQAWCLQFKQFMTLEAELANLPFEFAKETTRRDFDHKKQKEFFQRQGIYGQGLWQLEFPNSNQDFLVGGTIQNEETDEKSIWSLMYSLELEYSLLKIAPGPAKKALYGWRDYYAFRGFSMDSLIAVLLHFPLTVYYIVSQLLPQDFQETFASIQKSQKICIHLIGAEKEVQMFYPFLECSRILFPISIQIHLFGNNFDSYLHDQVMTKENLHFQIHYGLYHKMDHKNIPSPDLAVCLNGGIGAYSSYLKTVKYLTRNKIPFYYTDYGQASMAFSIDTIATNNAGHSSQLQVNPFRCPLRIITTDQNLPRYSNAFITCIKPCLK